VWAAEIGNVEMVKMLLNNNRIDASYNGCEALDKASRRGHVQVCRVLMDDPRVNRSSLHHRSKYTPVFLTMPVTNKV
jgi:hypothetical protein